MATASTDLVQVEPESSGILLGMSSLAPLKQIGLLIAIAASIALGAFIVIWSKEPAMRPLNNLSPEASMDVINYLEQQQIPYKVDTTGRLLVPQSRYKRIEIELGSQGIPLQESNSDTFLNKDSGFGVSQRMEKARLLRNQELQLIATLKQFSGIKDVNVHLAIPKESSFIKNRQDPSASILLQLYSRGSISDEQVASMVDLVSGSVPNMDRSKVTITDQFGRLHHSGSMTQLQRQSSKDLSVTRERQQDIKNRVEQILNPIVGVAAYTVQVNVDMDFTKKEQTLQTFNPDLSAIRSERTIDDSRTNGVLSGVPGALSNQPPGASVIPATNAAGQGQTNAADSNSNTNRRSEAERNYDLDTTISHIQPQVGVVNRISVSVGLDHIADSANAGQKIARSDEELERITRLIQAAIGFSVQRGDIVSVESFPFIKADVIPVPTPVAFYESELFQTLLQPFIGLILGLVLIFAVLRPLYKKLSMPPVVSSSNQMMSADDLEFSNLASTDGDLAGLANDQIMLAGHDGLQLPPPTVGEVKKLEQAKGVVNNNPTLVAQLVKNWIEEDA